MRPVLAAVALVLAALPARADQISDTLRSAIAAYEAGDVAIALQDVAIATQMLQQLQAQGLAAFLPEPPEGWRRTVNTDMAAGMSMMGGGTGAEAEYSGPGGSFRLTFMADNPMVMAFMGMFGNPMLMSQMGQVSRIGRNMVLDQNGDLTMLIENRILVQATGGSRDVMMPVLESIDFDALSGFGR